MRGRVTVIRIDYSVSSYHIISYSINIEPLQLACAHRMCPCPITLAVECGHWYIQDGGEGVVRVEEW